MIFWINLPLAAAALALLLPKMSKIPVFHRKRKVDWLGGVLLMASAVVFMLVLTWRGTRFPWLSPTDLAIVGGAVALAVAFVWHVALSAVRYAALCVEFFRCIAVLVQGACLRSILGYRPKRRRLAGRAASRPRQHPCDSRRRHSARVPLRLRRRHRVDDHCLALPDR